MKRLLFLQTIITILLFAVPAFADTVILPHRVIDARTKTVIDFEGLLARCADANVVTLGENHDDPATHMVELAILEGLARRHGNPILSLEMFERDVQDLLDQYLADEITEEEFLENSRPWGNYETDYRPMVEFARENGFPVIASNVPRPLAHRIAEGGYENVEYTVDELPFISATYEAPPDAYWEMFADTMRMPGMEAMGVTEEMIEWYYQSQVMKDETMAESISRAAETDPGAVVYHVNGGFHTADWLGTFSRVRRNLPGADCISIHVMPVDDILAAVPEDATKADYWILVQAPPPEEEEEMSMEEMMEAAMEESEGMEGMEGEEGIDGEETEPEEENDEEVHF